MPEIKLPKGKNFSESTISTTGVISSTSPVATPVTLEQLLSAIKNLEKKIEEMEKRAPIIINNPYPVYPTNNPVYPTPITSPSTTPNWPPGITYYWGDTAQ